MACRMTIFSLLTQSFLDTPFEYILCLGIYRLVLG